MSTRRIPEGAFSYYAALGPGRSYEAVAAHFGVSKRGIAKLAQREDWQGRLARAEAEAKERGHQRLVETLEEMNERHLKMLKAIQGRALEALRSVAMHDPAKASQALVRAVEMERVVRGEPADRAAVEIEEIVRRESERWLRRPQKQEDGDTPAGDTPDGDAGDDGDGGDGGERESA